MYIFRFKYIFTSLNDADCSRLVKDDGQMPPPLLSHYANVPMKEEVCVLFFVSLCFQGSVSCDCSFLGVIVHVNGNYSMP